MEKTKLIDQARGFLIEQILDGPKLSSKIFEEGSKRGLNERILRRAREDLGFETYHYGKSGDWWWYDPKLEMSPEQKRDWIVSNINWIRKNIENFDELFDSEQQMFEYELVFAEKEGSEDETIVENGPWHIYNRSPSTGAMVQSLHYDNPYEALEALGPYFFNHRDDDTQVERVPEALPIAETKVEKWLESLLNEGPVELQKIHDKAKKEGVSFVDVKQAFKKLKYEEIDSGLNSTYWSNPNRGVEVSYQYEQDHEKNQKERYAHEEAYREYWGRSY
ncbi:MAG: hypothetical protein GF334_02725 [Candidatus Altiarchaeales archaeon]|nr:hypothetical protein [Candidatus Altiarchaeales archaeon]